MEQEDFDKLNSVTNAQLSVSIVQLSEAMQLGIDMILSMIEVISSHMPDEAVKNLVAIVEGYQEVADKMEASVLETQEQLDKFTGRELD